MIIKTRPHTFFFITVPSFLIKRLKQRRKKDLLALRQAMIPELLIWLRVLSTADAERWGILDETLTCIRKEGREEEKIWHGHIDKVAVAASIVPVLPLHYAFLFRQTQENECVLFHQLKVHSHKCNMWCNVRGVYFILCFLLLNRYFSFSLFLVFKCLFLLEYYYFFFIDCNFLIQVIL